MATRNLNTREDGATTSTNTNTTQPKQNDTTHTAKKSPNPGVIHAASRRLLLLWIALLSHLTSFIFVFAVRAERLIVLQRKQPQGRDYLLGSNS